MRRFLLNWWTLSLLTLLLFALLLAVALPYLILPMRPWLIRLLIVAGLVLIWLVFAAVHVLTARKASDAIATELTREEPGAAERGVLAKRMSDALAGLRKASGNRRDYLYSRPWYVIIGPPAAGKTTALLNSGLRFPFADTELSGIGGTRNLDFSFADEAVLVDTAGRYTTQDAQGAVDAGAWRAFLAILRKQRPLMPINGVLVAIGFDDLLKADRRGLDAHATAVRRRLLELRQTLQVSAPVYVIFTKADLLAGFGEYFEDLDVEGRRAVLGATLPPDGEITPAVLAEEFDSMAQAVADRGARRLQDVTDARRRALILGFPSQMEAARARILRFLDGAFAQDGELAPMLRGFYLASGVQDGAPLDRLLSGAAEIYDVAPTAGRSAGRAYFLNRLLSEVVIPEAGMVQADAGVRARRRLVLAGGLAVMAAVTVALMVAWGISFVANRTFQTRLLAAAQDSLTTMQGAGIHTDRVRSGDPDLEAALPVLRALRNLPGGYAARRSHHWPTVNLGFGLYQGGLSSSAEQTYLEGLRRILLPRLLLRQEQVLRERQSDPVQVYDALKVYLMLGGQGPFSRSAVRSWILSDWTNDALAGADRDDERAELTTHLDTLLADRDFGRVWGGRQAPLDGDLIRQSQAAAQSLSYAQRAYAILRQNALDAGPAWLASDHITQADAAAFVNPPLVLRQAVPYFYTQQGYRRAYLAGLQTVATQLQRDHWVLGPDAERTSILGQMSGLRSQVGALYARDYIAAWDAVVASMHPADFFHNQTAFGAFTHDPSPLKVILLEVRLHTKFAAGAPPRAPGAVNLPGGIRVPGALTSAMAGPGQSIDVGATITNHFREMNDYVGDGRAPGRLDDFITAVRTAGSANVSLSLPDGDPASGGALRTQLATAMGSVMSAATQAPPMLRPFAAETAQPAPNVVTHVEHGAVADDYTRNILAACRTETDGAYPFAVLGTDANVGRLSGLFGSNGLFDSFIHNRLGPYLDTSGPSWRWRADNPAASGFNPSSAQELKRASLLRDMFVTGLHLPVEKGDFGGAVTAVELTADGVAHRFEATTTGQQEITWTVSGAQTASLVLYGADQAEVMRVTRSGPWALFRLLDTATRQTENGNVLAVTFSLGANSASLRITRPANLDPIGHGGVWSFHCPASL